MASVLKWVGILALIAFALTGQYMAFVIPYCTGVLDQGRMMLRASHIYILLAGVCSVSIAVYYRPFETARARLLQIVGSSMLALAPPILLTAFVLEAAAHAPLRPMTEVGCWLMLLGGIATLLAGRFERRQQGR